MTQRKVRLVESGAHAFTELVADDIPDLSSLYDPAGAAAAAEAASDPAGSAAAAAAASVPTSRTITAGSGLSGGGDLSANRSLAVDFGEAGDISTQAFGDAAAAGSTGEVADAGHKHGMPAAPAVGLSPGQVISYPSSFSGDTINGSSTTPFVDVAAFDTKEVLNSRIVHLQTKGASKDHKVRVTLGTTKAGAFDVRVALAFKGLPWSSADNNTYADVRLTTAAGAAQLAVGRLQGFQGDSISSFTFYPPVCVVKFGGSSVAAIGDNFTPMAMFGEVMTLRFVRDGSDVIRFYAQSGVAPLALPGIILRSNFEPYTVTQSGTLACIEFTIHTPSGPGSAVEYDVWLDYLQSV